jgi:hypothetical protein
MTNEQKEKIVKNSFNSVLQVVQLHGLANLFLVDKAFSSLCLAIYLQAFDDLRKYEKEIEEEVNKK